ncbi:MAG: GNAT family N-acetyltransferase [Agarilytica sp.]
MLKGEKIFLRNIQSKDLDALVELWGNLSSRGEYFPLTIFNETTLKQRFSENGFWGEAGGHMLIVDSRDEIQGAIFYFQPNPFLAYVEVGYILFHPDSRGKGYTSEALALFSKFLFEVKQISKILLNIDPANAGSKKVAEKNGFVLEGVDRKAMYRNGQYLDVERYVLLRN